MKLRHFLMIINSAIMVLPLLYTLTVGVVTFLLGKWRKKADIKEYGFVLLLSVDQMANSVLLGHEDETISSRTGRAILSGKPKGWVKIWRRVLDKGAEWLGDDPEHSVRAVEKRFVNSDELWYWHEKSPKN